MTLSTLTLKVNLAISAPQQTEEGAMQVKARLRKKLSQIPFSHSALDQLGNCNTLLCSRNLFQKVAEIWVMAITVQLGQ